MAATSALRVDSSNEDQLRAWDGDEGAYWADHADYFDRSVAAYHRRLLDQAAIQTHDRVLDVGCGTGQTTRDAARVALAGSALGVDLSSRMLDHARRRAAEEGLANATFAQADAQVHAFEPASSTWPSAAPRRCSSATTSRRSATSGVPCVPAGDCCS